MRKLVDFSKTPSIIEVIDEEFAEYERRNAKEIERRELMRGHDEAQAIYNAQKRRDAHWQAVIAGKDAAIADKDAENEKLKGMIAKLQAKLSKKQ